MKYAVSDEGVTALMAMSSGILESVALLYQATTKMQTEADSFGETLGPHRSSLNGALKTIYECIKIAVEPCSVLSETLKDVAEAYQDVIDNNSLAQGQGYEGGTAGASGNTPGSTSQIHQSAHKEYIDNYQGQVKAVQDDVHAGSGRNVSEQEASRMLHGIQAFSGCAFSRIRSAYNNPNAYSKDAELMQAVDDYIHSAPKWEGRVYRGINVTKEQAAGILSGGPIDMLGPSSWSSELNVAERFSDGYKDVRIVFVLDDNKSGASITHIGSWDGTESEVTAPSGVKYQFDGAKRVKSKGSEIIFIDVHE